MAQLSGKIFVAAVDQLGIGQNRLPARQQTGDRQGRTVSDVLNGKLSPFKRRRTGNLNPVAVTGPVIS